MCADILQRRDPAPIRQFTVFADNKVGRLHELIQLLNQHHIQVLAFSQVDTTECTVMRLIVNYPQDMRTLLEEHAYAYTCVELIAVELDSPMQFSQVTAALIEAEINIHYVYAFMARPQRRTALALCLEDNDLAAQVLTTHGLTVLDQHDLAR